MSKKALTSFQPLATLSSCQNLLSVSLRVPSFSGYCHGLSSQMHLSIRLWHERMLYFNQYLFLRVLENKSLFYLQ